MAQRPFVLDGNRYEALQCVGRGASAEVWRGQSKQSGEPVALKLLRSDAQLAATAPQFAREATLLTRIDSPFVVRLLEQCQTDAGLPCLVLQWAPGVDLAALQRETPVDRDDAVRFGRQAARALGAVHRAGLVHRDVKPSNFVVDPEGPGGLTVRLIDLGVALRAGQEDQTWRGMRVGTPAYMSPEQARGHRALDARSDLFSLGVILYELLSGVRPFGTGDPFAVLARILFEPPRPLEELQPTLPHALCALVARAMEPEPERRFLTADDMAEALDALAPAPLGATTGAWLAATSPPARGALSDPEQRVLTVLLVEGLPEATTAHGALGRTFEDAGAQVRKVAGGRLVALWGMGSRLGDEAHRAARAALGVLALAPELRMVLATGHARADGMPQGELFDRAVRVLRAARGPLALDEDTASLLEGHLLLVGASQNSPALLQPGPSSATLTVGGHHTPTVGRERELGWLEMLAAHCFERAQATAVLVTAPAGAGKSRLAAALFERLARRTDAPAILLGRGLDLGAVGVLAPLGEALRSHLGLGHSGSTERERELLEARLLQVPALAADEAQRRALQALAGLEPPQDADATTRDPIVLADVLLEAWLHWLEHECARGPVLLALEDLHWADGATVRFVDRALEHCASRPLLVLALSRPELHARAPELWKHHPVQELRLGPLPRRAAEQIARAVLGEDASEDAVSALVERAGGNAFFLEELLRARLAGEEQAPPSVLGLVQARTDTLAPLARRVLRAASVYGRRFRRAGASALLDADEAAQVPEALAVLCSAELVVQRPGSTEEYDFAHDLLREALYDTLSEQDRTRAHRAAGRWLHASGERDGAALAYHFERGDELPQAARFYRRAVEYSLGADALEQAIEHATAGLRCAPDDALAGHLLRLRADARAWRGELASSQEDASAAQKLLREGSPEWLRALGRRMANLALTGSRTELAAALESLPGAPTDESALDAWRQVVCRAVEYLLVFGEVEYAEQWLGQPGVRPPSTAHWSTVARAAMTEGLLALARARVGLYLASMGDAMALFEWHDDRRDACRCRSELGWALTLDGRLADGERQLRATLAQAERLQLPVVSAWTLHRLGRVLDFRGAHVEARACQQRVLDAGPSAGRRLPVRALFAMADSWLRSGDHARCLATLEMLPPLATVPAATAAAATVRAEVALWQGDPQRALSLLAGSLELDVVLRESPELHLRLPLVHALALQASGAPRSRVRAAIADAAAYVESLYAQWPEAERESRLNAVPERAAVRTLARAVGA